MDTFIMLQKVAAANSEALEILEKVDGFYNNAWGKLMALTTIFGFLIPILTNLVPYFNYKTLKEDFEKKSEEIKNLKNDFQNSTNKYLQENAWLGGSLYLLQGNILSEKNRYMEAIESYINSIEQFNILKDETHIKSGIKNFLLYVGEIDVELYKNFLKLNSKKINTLIEDLNQYPSSNFHDSTYIRFIQNLTIHE